MKVIEIQKNVQGRINKHHIVVSDNISDEDIEYLVSDWCCTDLSGQNYGYSYTWVVITDDIHRKEVIAKELLKIDSQISKLLREKESLLDIKEKELNERENKKRV